MGRKCVCERVFEEKREEERDRESMSVCEEERKRDQKSQS